MNAYIYELSDPRDGIVRYVGQTTDPAGRHRQHCRGGDVGNIPKGKWIAVLASLGLEPAMKIVATVDAMDADAAEQQHIQKVIGQNCRLFNRANGGGTRAHTRRLHATPDDWIAFGNEVKAMKAALSRAIMLGQEVAGLPAANILMKVEASVQTAQRRLDEIVCNTRREWGDATRVFYGEPMQPIGSISPAGPVNFAELYDALRKRGLGFADIERMTFDQVNFEFTRNAPEPRDLEADAARRRAAAFAQLDQLCRAEKLSVLALKDQPASNTAAELRGMGHRAEPEMVAAMVSEYVAWKIG